MKKPNLPAYLLLLSSSLLSAAPCIWTPDPTRSKITVEVKSTADDFTATLTSFDSEIKGDTDGAAPVNAVKISWDMAKLDTADAKRDKHMAEWCDPKTHPSNSWTLTSFETRGTKTIAKGKLSLHGVTKDIEIPVTLARTPVGELTVDGAVSFDHRDFGLPKIRSFLVLTVEPVVTVKFHLEAKSGPLTSAPKPASPKHSPAPAQNKP